MRTYDKIKTPSQPLVEGEIPSNENLKLTHLIGSRPLTGKEGCDLVFRGIIPKNWKPISKEVE